MSSDVKIPEWAMRQAEVSVFAFEGRIQSGEFEGLDPEGSDARDALKSTIALALLAAEQRGCKAGLEEAAKVAEGYDGDGLIGSYDCHLGDARLTVREIAAAIRSLGDHHDR